MGRTAGWGEAATVIAMLLLCLLFTFSAMRGADWLVNILGRTGADVTSRVSGVLLAGLAIQFVFDGLSEASFLHGSQAL